MNYLLSIWQKRILPAGQVLIHSFREFQKDDCFARAAALSYTTLLSLVPILAVSFSIYSSFGQFENNLDDVRRYLFEYVNPASIEAIEGFYETLLASSEKATAVGVVGLVALIVTAWALLNSVENSMNFIWGIRRSRSLFKRFVAYTAIIFWVPILISLSVYLTGLLRSYFFGSELAQQSLSFQISTMTLPFLFTWGAFFFAFTAIPNCSVPWRASLVGSLVAGLLWEMAKVGFDYYINEVSSFRQLYSALGTIPLFLLWVYYSWLIVLYGAELSFAMAHPELRRQRGLPSLQQTSLLALQIMKTIAARFVQGESPLHLEELGKALDIPLEQLIPLLLRLEQEGLITRTGEESPAYILSRSPEKLTLQSIVETVEGDSDCIHCADTRLAEQWKEAERMRRSVLSQKTLAGLLE